MKITKINQRGIDLIKSFEGLRYNPYMCSANVATIGYGTTIYPNNVKVTLQDKAITLQQAELYLANDLIFFERQVDTFTTDAINQNQFNALVSFSYNLGANALKNSTLLKKVNANVNDITIKAEFMKWVNANGRKVAGLVRRREAEANMYFS